MDIYSLYVGNSHGIVYQIYNVLSRKIKIELIGTDQFFKDYDKYYNNRVGGQIPNYTKKPITNKEYNKYKKRYLANSMTHMHAIFISGTNPIRTTGWVIHQQSNNLYLIDILCDGCHANRSLPWFCNCKLVRYCSKKCLDNNRSTHNTYCPTVGDTQRICVKYNFTSKKRKRSSSGRDAPRCVKIFINNRVYEYGTFKIG